MTKNYAYVLRHRSIISAKTIIYFFLYKWHHAWFSILPCFKGTKLIDKYTFTVCPLQLIAVTITEDIPVGSANEEEKGSPVHTQNVTCYNMHFRPMLFCYTIIEQKVIHTTFLLITNYVWIFNSSLWLTLHETHIYGMQHIEYSGTSL